MIGTSIPDRALPLTGAEYERQLIRILRERSAPLTQRDLAVRLAATMEGKPPSDVTVEERTEVEIVLHHRYLPSLSDAGLIDRRSDGIVSTERLSSLELEALA